MEDGCEVIDCFSEEEEEEGEKSGGGGLEKCLEVILNWEEDMEGVDGGRGGGESEDVGGESNCGGFLQGGNEKDFREEVGEEGRDIHNEQVICGDLLGERRGRKRKWDVSSYWSEDGYPPRKRRKIEVDGEIGGNEEFGGKRREQERPEEQEKQPPPPITKKSEDDDEVIVVAVKRGRGRPKKSEINGGLVKQKKKLKISKKLISTNSGVKRGRGRPRKYPIGMAPPPKPKINKSGRGRGRPRKNGGIPDLSKPLPFTRMRLVFNLNEDEENKEPWTLGNDVNKLNLPALGSWGMEGEGDYKRLVYYDSIVPIKLPPKRGQNPTKVIITNVDSRSKEESRVNCPRCDSTFKLNFHLKRHILKVHDETRPFKCHLCNHNFASAAYFKYHNSRVHSTEDSKEKLAAQSCSLQSKGNRCNICGKKAKDRWKLARHISTVHDSSRPYECCRCNRSFNSAAHFKRHESLYHLQGDKHKKLACNICGEMISRKEMSRHTLTHDDLDLYRCQLCGFATVERSSFKNHIKSVHGAKKRKCISKNKPVCKKPDAEVLTQPSVISKTENDLRDVKASTDLPVCENHEDDTGNSGDNNCGREMLKIENSLLTGTTDIGDKISDFDKETEGESTVASSVGANVPDCVDDDVIIVAPLDPLSEEMSSPRNEMRNEASASPEESLEECLEIITDQLNESSSSCNDKESEKGDEDNLEAEKLDGLLSEGDRTWEEMPFYCESTTDCVRPVTPEEDSTPEIIGFLKRASPLPLTMAIESDNLTDFNEGNANEMNGGEDDLCSAEGETLDDTEEIIFEEEIEEGQQEEFVPLADEMDLMNHEQFSQETEGIAEEEVEEECFLFPLSPPRNMSTTEDNGEGEEEVEIEIKSLTETMTNRAEPEEAGGDNDGDGDVEENEVIKVSHQQWHFKCPFCFEDFNKPELLILHLPSCQTKDNEGVINRDSDAVGEGEEENAAEEDVADTVAVAPSPIKIPTIKCHLCSYEAAGTYLIKRHIKRKHGAKKITSFSYVNGKDSKGIGVEEADKLHLDVSAAGKAMENAPGNFGSEMGKETTDSSTQTEDTATSVAEKAQLRQLTGETKMILQPSSTLPEIEESHLPLASFSSKAGGSPFQEMIARSPGTGSMTTAENEFNLNRSSSSKVILTGDNIFEVVTTPVVLSKLYSCTKCEFSCSSQANLDDHIASVHVDFWALHCSICRRGFQSSRILKFHEATAHSENVAELEEGEEVEEEEEEEEMIETQEVAQTENDNEAEANVAVDEDVTIDEILNITATPDFQFPTQMEASTIRKLNDISSDIIAAPSPYPLPSPPPSESLALNRCKRLSAQKLSYKDLITGENPGSSKTTSIQIPKEADSKVGGKFQCEICEKSYFYSWGLKRHIDKEHPDKKRVKCLKCLKSFASSSELQSHKVFHIGQGSYKCPLCKKAFLYCYSRTRHMKICRK